MPGAPQGDKVQLLQVTLKTEGQPVFLTPEPVFLAPVSFFTPEPVFLTPEPLFFRPLSLFFDPRTCFFLALEPILPPPPPPNLFSGPPDRVSTQGRECLRRVRVFSLLHVRGVSFFVLRVRGRGCCSSLCFFFLLRVRFAFLLRVRWGARLFLLRARGGVGFLCCFLCMSI